MKNRLLYVIGGLMATAGTSVYGGLIDLSVGIQVQTCTGAYSICTQEGKLNAVNEQATFKVTDVVNKGTLEGEQKMTFELPQVVNTAKAYTVTPSAGERAGQEIEIAFRKLAPRAGKAGETGLKQLVIFYRKGEKADEWFEFGRAINKQDNAPESLTFDVFADGKFVITAQNGDKNEYFVGDKVLKAKTVRAAMLESQDVKPYEKATGQRAYYSR